MSDESEAKTDPASKRKLRKLRNDGMIASGQEFSGFFACAAGILYLLASFPIIYGSLSTGIINSYEQMNTPFPQALRNSLESAIYTVVISISGLVCLVFLIGIVSNLLFNGGFVFSLKPVSPKLKNISPWSGIKRIFGRRGWIELAASLLRLLVWTLLAGFLGYIWIPLLLATPLCEENCALNIIVPFAVIVVIVAVVILLISSGLSGVVQRNQFLHEQRMTKSELKRERKDQNGSPEVTRERKRLQREIARKPSVKANLTSANFLFYDDERAMAVRYVPSEDKFPYVMAKITDKKSIMALKSQMTGQGKYQTDAPEFLRVAFISGLGETISAEHYTQFGVAVKSALQKK